MLPWTKNRVLKKALSLYAGNHVLSKVLRDGDAALQPETQTIELTILFLDIADFVNVGQGLDPLQLGTLTTNYYEAVTQSISRCGGTFDTFIGDAASAWWGIDGKQDHPLLACNCAKDLLSAVHELNLKSKSAGLSEIKLKIGIHTGRVSLGNFGSSLRLKYTAMGNAVNLASRLCGIANSQYPFPILVSDVTNKRLKGELPTQLVDTVNVKGKDVPMEIYGIAF